MNKDIKYVLGPLLTYSFYPPPTPPTPPNIITASQPIKDNNGIYNITNEGELLYILTTNDFYISDNDEIIDEVIDKK